MFILRFFPRVLHAWLSKVLPSAWIIRRHLRQAKKFLIPIIEERAKALNRLDFEKPVDLLQYMIENAEGEDVEPERLAHLELMANTVGIHTTSGAITHAVFDLCAHPEYVEILRKEIEQVQKTNDDWQKNAHTKLHKMDSFFKESQRFSPAGLCASIRFFTFIKGVELPRASANDTSVVQSCRAYVADPLLRIADPRWHPFQCCGQACVI